jgi:hypothetical protein
MFTPTHPITHDGSRPSSSESPKPIPIAMTMVCDAEGATIWFRSEELVVIEIDGAGPASLLKSAGYR